MNVVNLMLTPTEMLLSKFTLLHGRHITDPDFIQPQTDIFDDGRGGRAHSTFVWEMKAPYSLKAIKFLRMSLCVLLLSPITCSLCVFVRVCLQMAVSSIKGCVSVGLEGNSYSQNAELRWDNKSVKQGVKYQVPHDVFISITLSLFVRLLMVCASKETFFVVLCCF